MTTPFAYLAAPEPAVAEQLPDLIEAAVRSLAGAPVAAIERLLGMFSVAFPAARVSSAEAAMRVELYAAGLSDLPEDALQSGMLEGVKVWRFFPTIAEIREQAEPFVTERRRILRALENLSMRAIAGGKG